MDTHIFYGKDGEGIPREYFPIQLNRSLENLENHTGLQFDDVGWRSVAITQPSIVIAGYDIEGRNIRYRMEMSGRVYIWDGDKEYKLSEMLPDLRYEFNRKMRYLKERGEGLKELGVDTKGLELGGIFGLGDLVEDMGAEVPYSEDDHLEKLTKEEKRNLSKEWKEYLKKSQG